MYIKYTLSGKNKTKNKKPTNKQNPNAKKPKKKNYNKN